MAFVDLPTNIDTSYADGAGAGTKLHQQAHDALHAAHNATRNRAALSTAERDALAGEHRWTGRVIYNTTTGTLEVFDGAAWVTAGGSGGYAAAFLTMGA